LHPMKNYTSLLYILPLTALLACSSGNTGEISTDVVTNPASASGSADEEKLPVLTFESESYDFGKVKQGDKVSHDFAFTNTGKTDLIISSASASCGCTVPDYSKEPVGPGEKGVIHVVFDTNNKNGPQNKTVTVLANTNPNSRVLTLTGEVTVPEEAKQ
jgi:hypothetical protein